MMYSITVNCIFILFLEFKNIWNRYQCDEKAMDGNLEGQTIPIHS